MDSTIFLYAPIHFFQMNNIVERGREALNEPEKLEKVFDSV